VLNQSGEKLANVIFATIHDRRGQSILSIRAPNTFDTSLRKRRLIHLLLIHRSKSIAVHYLTPTTDNLNQTARMQKPGLYCRVANEIGEIIVADVALEGGTRLLDAEGTELRQLIQKKDATKSEKSTPAMVAPA
jgi:isocitrate lyase